MTIVVGVAAPDGLILAGDSRTSFIPGEGPPRVMSDFAQKVFDLDGFGIATYGQALISHKTIAGQVEEFIALKQDDPPDNVDALAASLGEFFQERLLKFYDDLGSPWDKSKGWTLGFLVAGYDTSGVGVIREVRVPAENGAEIIDPGPSTINPGFTWQGEDDVITRLIAGFDRRRFLAANVAMEPPALQALADLEYTLIMPQALQDAVDLGHLLIRTTIDMQRFSYGTRNEGGSVTTCGGPINVLAVRRRGSEWVDSRPLTTASRPGWAEGAR